MPISNRLAFRHCSTSNGLSSRTALYGPVRRVVWQGSVGDRRPYADLVWKHYVIGPGRELLLRSPRGRHTI
jgi:hypothetical protein